MFIMKGGRRKRKRIRENLDKLVNIERMKIPNPHLARLPISLTATKQCTFCQLPSDIATKLL